MSDQGNSEDVEDRNEIEDDDLCVVCRLGEDKDNEEGELWLECTTVLPEIFTRVLFSLNFAVSVGPRKLSARNFLRTRKF